MSLNTCRRCGTCCRKGGPALHGSDLPLLEHIPVRDLVCLRRGEPAFDPRRDGLTPLEEELLKIRGKDDGWECVYFSRQPVACSIYGHRPLECRSLSCADTGGILEAMGTPAITRRDIVTPDSALWECIAEHERLFPVAQAMRQASELRIGTDVPEALDSLIRHELHFRRGFAERVGVRDEDLWAYFGRPLWVVLAAGDRRFGRYGQERH